MNLSYIYEITHLVANEINIMTQQTPFDIKHFLPYQLSILSNLVSGLIAEEYKARFGITVPEWRVIVVLANAGELTATDIAEATLMDKVRVTRTVQSLIKAKIASRRASKEDGRSTLLTLTKKGLAIYNEIIPLAKEAESKIMETLTPKDRKDLQRMIKKMSAQLSVLETHNP